MVRTNVEALPKNAHVSAFLVPRDTPGVSIGKPDGKMGQAGSQIADVILEDVHVDGDALLGGAEGNGLDGKSGGTGTSVSARVAHGGSRVLKENIYIKIEGDDSRTTKE